MMPNGHGENKTSFLQRLRSGLAKSRADIQDQLRSVFSRHNSFDGSVWEELEEVLIRADVGVGATLTIIEKMKEIVFSKKLPGPADLYPFLKDELIDILTVDEDKKPLLSGPGLTVCLMTGVNGTGKTTTIAKLARLIRKEGKKPLLVAADTFRAAAIEQLEEWGKKTGIDVIKHQRGADASAVVYDALQAAKSRGVDTLLVDTAGRLHTYVNLMEELKKIKRIALREAGEAQVLTFQVIDATTGQNAIAQARTFHEAIGLDGIILTKIDGTAKGGIVIAIKAELDLPIVYIGLGEKLDDLQEFKALDFVEALLTV